MIAVTTERRQGTYYPSGRMGEGDVPEDLIAIARQLRVMIDLGWFH